MKKIILGIESSCDDTSASIIDSDGNILSNIVLSQVNEHLPYQGVVPEIASRAHLNYLGFAVEEALKESKKSLNEIDLICATGGPGLIGGVIVGTMYAKALSYSLKKPYVAVNHLEGHALSIRLSEKIDYPYLLLLISGGHCQFISVESLGNYKILGKTLDDAVGEAFDKVAKMMNLGYPGGPIIEKRALDGKLRFKFPVTMYGKDGCNMSFSGLKTAVRRVIESEKNIDDDFINDICASFQHTILEIFKDRLEKAILEYEKSSNKKNIVIAGGVAANRYLFNNLKLFLSAKSYNLYSPPMKLCTDNAAMIAWAGYERYMSGYRSNINFCPVARWPLSDL